MLFHLIHTHKDIDTKKPTVAIRPGLNSGAHILYYIYFYSSKNDSNQTNRKEHKKLDSEHNIENTVTYTPT